MREGDLIAKLPFLTLVTALAVATVSPAATVVVDWSGGGDHLLIQSGINAASEGDTVLVRPGIYTGEGNRALDFDGTDRVLMSHGGPDSVTIDCGGEASAFIFENEGGPSCVIDGFTITNGAANYGAGASFSASAATVRNCVFSGNSAALKGGAVFCTTASAPSFINCTFSSNYAAVDGGAVFSESTADPTFTNCDFVNNEANSYGGAMVLYQCPATLTDCTFDGNGATASGSYAGALYLFQTHADANLTRCDFTGNTADSYAGAMDMNSTSHPTITDCTFMNNTAGGGGAGAIRIRESSNPAFERCAFGNNSAPNGQAVYCVNYSTPQFTDCLFYGHTGANAGGAMYFHNLCTPVLTGCTFYLNGAITGGTIWCDDDFTLTNSIIAFGVGGEAIYCDGDPPEPTCSDIYGNAGGDWVGCLAGLDLVDNNLHADPLFCDAPIGDFTIDAASPCTAANAPACGLVGAFDIGCDSPVKAESWGAIKAMYR